MNVSQAIEALSKDGHSEKEIEDVLSGNVNPDVIKRMVRSFTAGGYSEQESLEFIDEFLEDLNTQSKPKKSDPVKKIAEQKAEKPFFFDKAEKEHNTDAEKEFVQDPEETMTFKLFKSVKNPKTGKMEKVEHTATAYFGEFCLEDTMRLSAKFPYWAEYLGYGVKDFLSHQWSVVDLVHLCLVIVQRAISDYDLEKEQPTGFAISVLDELHRTTGLSVSELRAMKNSQVYQLVIKMFQVNSPFFATLWQKAGPIRELHSFLRLLITNWKDQQKLNIENIFLSNTLGQKAKPLSQETSETA